MLLCCLGRADCRQTDGQTDGRTDGQTDRLLGSWGANTARRREGRRLTAAQAVRRRHAQASERLGFDLKSTRDQTTGTHRVGTAERRKHSGE